VATFDHSVPRSGALALRAWSDRITAAVMKVLCGALAAVYLYSAVTMPVGHGVVATGEAAIAALQLAWIALVSLREGRRWVYVAGIALQLVLTAVWVVTRTVGLPGIGRLPVGEFDLLCALDALMIAALCWRCGPWSGVTSARVRLGVCQLAVILAACTAYMSMASMMAMSQGVPTNATEHGAAAPHLFCHLL
jgi:hypothetical protein